MCSTELIKLLESHTKLVNTFLSHFEEKIILKKGKMCSSDLIKLFESHTELINIF